MGKKKNRLKKRHRKKSRDERRDNCNNCENNKSSNQKGVLDFDIIKNHSFDCECCRNSILNPKINIINQQSIMIPRDIYYFYDAAEIKSLNEYDIDTLAGLIDSNHSIADIETFKRDKESSLVSKKVTEGNIDFMDDWVDWIIS